MSAFTREHCTCVVVQNLDYGQAAEALNLSYGAKWLQDNLAKLPHQKFGKNKAVFCHCDLRVIQAMYAVLPPEAAKVISPPAETPEQNTDQPKHPAVPAYAAARPSQGRRRQAAGV
ncbi:hypothetical protein [Streptomyces tendae]|uniref:hypothetical protein n=1 Tax=Streptomyces tendae TaxID=1932 RepID=UPI00342E5922